jgi:hypothetical protein
MTLGFAPAHLTRHLGGAMPNPAPDGSGTTGDRDYGTPLCLRRVSRKRWAGSVRRRRTRLSLTLDDLRTTHELPTAT